MQKPLPAIETVPVPEREIGVTVKLTAIDPNGNDQDIGEVTTDIWGNYGIDWVPPVPGKYFIVAEFEGTESYWGSADSTYITVDPAPSPAMPIEPEQPTEPEEPEAPLITTEVAIIAAVAVVIGIAAYWVLRKRG